MVKNEALSHLVQEASQGETGGGQAAETAETAETEETEETRGQVRGSMHLPPLAPPARPKLKEGMRDCQVCQKRSIMASSVPGPLPRDQDALYRAHAVAAAAHLLAVVQHTAAMGHYKEAVPTPEGILRRLSIYDHLDAATVQSLQVLVPQFSRDDAEREAARFLGLEQGAHGRGETTGGEASHGSTQVRPGGKLKRES